MNPEMRAVVFDLDGTLTDSMPIHSRAWDFAFREICGFVPSEEEIYLREGEKGEEFARYICRKYSGVEPNESTLGRLVRTYKEEFDSKFELRFFPGAAELVESLGAAGIPLGLVSGSKEVRERLALANNFASKFSVIVSGDDTRIGKPDPAPFLLAFEKLGISSSQTLVIENAPLGLRAATAAGASRWAVLNNSPLSAEELTRAGAERVFPDLEGVGRELGMF